MWVVCFDSIKSNILLFSKFFHWVVYHFFNTPLYEGHSAGTIKYFFLHPKFISKRKLWTFVVPYLSLSRSTVVKGWLLWSPLLISKCEVWTFVVHYLSLSWSTVAKGWLLWSPLLISKREVWTFVVHYLSLSRSTVVKGWLLMFEPSAIASPADPR